MNEKQQETVNILNDQYSDEFDKGRRARMEMSFFVYGDLRDAYPHKVSAINSLLLRLDAYLGENKLRDMILSLPAVAHKRKPGNTEYLMDAANFCMIEWMLPSHPEAHFKATDEDGSPGRVSAHGRASRDPNIKKFEYKHEGD